MGTSDGSRKRVVILGGGFAGAYCAQALERAAGRSGASAVLVDRNNYFVFHPLLVEAGTGSLEPRAEGAMTVPLDPPSREHSSPGIRL